MSDIERRRTFFGFGIERILRGGLQNRSGAGRQTAEHCAGVVQGFRKRIAGLEVQTDARSGVTGSGLESVITRMRAVLHDGFGAETADCVAGGIELRESRELRVGPCVAVRRKYAR